MTSDAQRKARRVSAPSVDASPRLKALPAVLSMTAGSVDVITFLGLGGLFTAHITGNLVILAARVVNGGGGQLAPALSVPIFILALGLTRLLAGGLERIGYNSLRPLLALQLLLLAAFLAVCALGGAHLDPVAALAVFGGMLGVSAMAVQNALVQISLQGAPATAVMTTNVSRFAMDMGQLVLGGRPETLAKARKRASHTWPAIAGFIVGGSAGAFAEVRFGLLSLVLPVALATLALVLAVSENPEASLRADAEATNASLSGSSRP